MALVHPRASLLIVGRNDAGRLGETIGACLESAAGLLVEVIVVATSPCAERAAAPYSEATVLVVPQWPGAATAKDLAATHAAGEVLVFLGAPARPEPGALARLVTSVEQTAGQALVAPRLADLDAASWENRASEDASACVADLERFECRPLGLEALRVFSRGGSNLRELPVLAGDCVALARRLYWRLGGFDGGLVSADLASLDLALRAWMLGHPVLLDAAAVVGRPAFDDDAAPTADRLADRLHAARKMLGDAAWDAWHATVRGSHEPQTWEAAERLFAGRRAQVERGRAALQAERLRNEFWYAERFGLPWPTRAALGTNGDSLAATPGAPPWHELPEVIAAHRARAEAFLDAIPRYPAGRFEGRGVILCAGGPSYFPCAWVCIHALRRRGCRLPIQLWYLGAREMDPRMRQLVAPYGVECIDAEALRARYPARILRGWELKCYALLHSPFREVILLDADNVPLIDPETLFATEPYERTGALFWPDYLRLGPDRSIWNLCGVPYRDEPEFESGQIVIDKARGWEPLQLAWHYNEYSDFYYFHIHGDKDTFHMAFRRLDRPYAMPARGIERLPGCMCQHDFDGARIFQHRNTDKWRLDGKNERIAGFRDEGFCLHALAELRTLWTGAPFSSDSDARTDLSGRRFALLREDGERFLLTLRDDGTIDDEGRSRARLWAVNAIDGRPVLTILTDHSVLCRLEAEEGAWRGAWLGRAGVTVELRSVAEAPSVAREAHR